MVRRVAGGHDWERAVRTQHRTRLVANVRRVAPVPGSERLLDGARIGAPSRKRRKDAYRHLGVVGPLAGRPTKRAASDHRDRCVRRDRRTELVAGAERVTGG